MNTEEAQELRTVTAWRDRFENTLFEIWHTAGDALQVNVRLMDQNQLLITALREIEQVTIRPGEWNTAACRTKIYALAHNALKSATGEDGNEPC